MKPALLDTIPEPLNTWMENKGYPDAAKTNIRTLQNIEKERHDRYYMTEEESACLDEWLKTLRKTKWVLHVD